MESLNIQKHYPELLRYALKKTGNRETAEDLVQEVFLAALESPQLQQIEKIQAWLFAVLKNKISQYYSNNAITETSVNFDKITWSPYNPEKEIERNEFRKSFYFCLSRLTPAKANAFRERERLQQQSTPPETMVSDGYFRVLVHRARAELKRCLQILGFDLERNSKQ